MSSDKATRLHQRSPLDELAVNQIPEEVDPHEVSYNPFQEPAQYRAFQEGWKAHQRQRSLIPLPYPLSRSEMARAWLDGWNAAQ